MAALCPAGRAGAGSRWSRRQCSQIFRRPCWVWGRLHFLVRWHRAGCPGVPLLTPRRPLRRQQTKWLIFGFGTTFPGGLAFIMLGALFPALEPPGTAGLLYELAGVELGRLWFLPLALRVGIALLRYRLFDIDVLIRQTLVYGTLTALLAAVYAGLIVGLESLIGSLTGRAS